MHRYTEQQAISLLAGHPLLGARRAREWISLFGSAQEVIQQTKKEIALLPGTSAALAACWMDSNYVSSWEGDWDWLQRHSIHVIIDTDMRLPLLLRTMPERPLVLYGWGDSNLLSQSIISIVGTRNATHYGLAMAEQLASELARAQFVITSGLARGIDTAAHKGALHYGTTIGVIGSGLKNIYPKENQELARIMQNKGLLLSPFSPSAPPHRSHFPKRNTIVSALATHGILLIEAPEKSGAMLTMRSGQKQGKRLYAIPGRADSDYFRGNHLLIKKREAELVEKATDIVANCATLFPTLLPRRPIAPLTDEEEELLRHLPNHEVAIEEIVTQRQLPVAKTQSLIMGLVMKKYITELPNRLIRKNKE